MRVYAHKYPTYSSRERSADLVIHAAGVMFSLIGSAWLLFVLPESTPHLSLVVYCFGLIAMTACSALYNVFPPGMAKEIFRRLDHAAIFVMIAGTYTPIAV